MVSRGKNLVCFLLAVPNGDKAAPGCVRQGQPVAGRGRAHPAAEAGANAEGNAAGILGEGGHGSAAIPPRVEEAKAVILSKACQC